MNPITNIIGIFKGAEIVVKLKVPLYTKAQTLSMYEAGAESERAVLKQVALNIASSPAKVLEESVLVGQALNRLDRTQQALLAERAVSDRLQFDLLAASNYIEALGGVSKSYRSAIAEVTAMRQEWKEKPE